MKIKIWLLSAVIGLAVFGGQDVAVLLESAKNGDAQAQYELGLYYGKPSKPQWEKAAFWYQKAVEQNHLCAKYSLSILYEMGRGVKKDPKKSFELMLSAAEQGSRFAQSAVAIDYQQGNKVEKDATEAFKWFKKAAEQNDFFSQRELAVCYLKGEGVEKDLVEAYVWLDIVVDQPSWYADRKKEVESALTPEQMDRAKLRRAEIIAKFPKNVVP